MENTEEIWRDIPNYEGYQVSNKGNVKSLKTRHVKVNGIIVSSSHNILKLNFSQRYVVIRVHANGRECNLSIHRAVAMAFIPNPLNKREVNHINGIKHDNRVENLEWCTPAENREHAVRTGLNRKGEKHPMSKLTKCHVLKIRELASQGMSARKIAKEIGIVKRTSIRDILIGKAWKHI